MVKTHAENPIGVFTNKLKHILIQLENLDQSSRMSEMYSYGSIPRSSFSARGFIRVFIIFRSLIESLCSSFVSIYDRIMSLSNYPTVKLLQTSLLAFSPMISRNDVMIMVQL